MSEKHVSLQTEDGQVLTAEYKDGQLQIVEVSPSFENKNGSPSHILPETNSEGSDSEQKYLQVLDTGKGLMQLDLINFTLVKCNDDDNSYQVVSSRSEDSDNTYQVVGASSDDESATITCVISAEDGDEGGDPDSFVVLDTEEGQDPLVILQSSLQQINSQTVNKNEGPVIKKPMTPTEILEKAKAIQRAKALLNNQKKQKTPPPKDHSRPKRPKFPPPMELLSSPNFKLYLYSCKHCNFKCNAVKEMSAHKIREHGSSRGLGAGSGRGHQQCARCPYKANTHGQLSKHIQDVHKEVTTKTLSLEALEKLEVKAADVLVCGACGFESGNRDVFKRHIEVAHGPSANC